MRLRFAYRTVVVGGKPSWYRQQNPSVLQNRQDSLATSTRSDKIGFSGDDLLQKAAKDVIIFNLLSDAIRKVKVLEKGIRISIKDRFDL